MDPNRLASELARNNLIAYAIAQWEGYQPAAHHYLIAQRLEAVEAGRIHRLMIFLPPRYGKSALASEFFPAWYIGRHPQRQIIFATYAQGLADDFGRKVRNQLRDPLFGALFPDCRIAEDSQAAKRFHTSVGGVYYAVGAGGPITGRGAHLLLIDDPIKGREDADSEAMRRKLKEWYSAVAYTRLMPGAAIVLIQTRWTQDDLAGWILKTHSHEGWDVLSLPAIDAQDKALWPEAYPLKRLKEIKATLGTREWAALYQQSPVIDGGNILRRSWWRPWQAKDPPKCRHIFQSYDTAYSEDDHNRSSYSARTTWGVFAHEDGVAALILLEAWRGRVDYPTLRKRALDAYREHQPDVVLIEKKSSGQSLVQDLRRAGIPVRTYNPDRDKVARAYAVQAMLECGQIWYPERKWTDEVIEECAAFPSGASSDYVDTCTQAWLYVRNGLYLLADEAANTHDDDDDTPAHPRAAYG